MQPSPATIRKSAQEHKPLKRQGPIPIQKAVEFPFRKTEHDFPGNSSNQITRILELGRRNPTTDRPDRHTNIL
jgi:hypothetical protein